MISQERLDAVLAALPDAVQRAFARVSPIREREIVRAVLEADAELRAAPCPKCGGSGVESIYVGTFGGSVACDCEAALRERLQRVEAERNDLRNELGSVSRDFDDALAERDSARAERDALAETVAAREGESVGSLPHVSAETPATVSVRSVYGRMIAEPAVVEAERDNNAGDRDHWVAVATRLSGMCEEAEAQRDAAREQVARLRAALRELIAAVEYDFTPHMSRGALTVESIEAARAAVEGGEPTG